MDLASTCKEKLAYFRIKELKDVLTKLGLSKQGKKQDLVDRILTILSDGQVSRMGQTKNAFGKEGVVKLVEDTYRKMQVSGVPDLAAKCAAVSGTSSLKPNEEMDDSHQSVSKIRCICGSSLEMDSTIQCDDPKCHVLQHFNCVIIADKPMERSLTPPEKFYCELCRLIRADPFWVAVAHPVPPVKLNIASTPTDGTNPVQTVERTFKLTREDKDSLLKQDYDIQAWCMLLNDKVPFRMQWPQYADLQLNGVPVRVVNRPGSQLLGANGRDDGPIITPSIAKDGINKICLTGCDARVFCLGVRLVKRCSLQQILSLIPKESDGESFKDALARVQRCVGGGPSADNADSDSDLEVVAEYIAVNLRCPMSGSRMKVAGRFKPCVHMGCFDLEIFVEMNQRSKKWQCPVCLKNYSVENIIIDPYFNRITSMMRHCGEDVTEVEVKLDGSWRVKSKSDSECRDLGDLCMWHLPDGSVCVPQDRDVKSEMEMVKEVKQEGTSYSPTSLKLRKNHNGIWEVGNFKISGEDASGGSFKISNNNGIEYDSIPLNVEPGYGFIDHNFSVPTVDAEVIVLSDSDDDVPMISSAPIFKDNHIDTNGVNFSVSPGISNFFPDDTNLGSGVGLGLFSNDGEFGMPILPLPPGNQVAQGLQLFGSDTDVAGAFGDLQHSAMNGSFSMNGYSLAPVPDMGSTLLFPESAAGNPEVDINGGLVDNPMAFGVDDPSLNFFLATRDSDASVRADFGDQRDTSNGGISTDDWISLRLGGGASGNQGPSRTVNGTDLGTQLPSRDGALESLADTATLLLGMNSGKSDNGSRQVSDSTFSFPRQKRSVRKRVYLSIESDPE